MHVADQSKRLVAIFVVSVVFTLCHAAFGKDHVDITSVPSGATVEIDGIAVGKTPYEVEVPGGYLHGTKSVFGKVLRQQMHLRLILDGVPSLGCGPRARTNALDSTEWHISW